METIKYPEVKVRLVGEDGNAYSILGRVKRALLESGATRTEAEIFVTEATSGDYDHLLRTCFKWVSCDMDDEDDKDDEDWDTDHCGWCDELHEDCECEAE